MCVCVSYWGRTDLSLSLGLLAETPPTASSQPPRGQGWPWETGRLEPQAMEVEPGGEKPASPGECIFLLPFIPDLSLSLSLSLPLSPLS